MFVTDKIISEIAEDLQSEFQDGALHSQWNSTSGSKRIARASITHKEKFSDCYCKKRFEFMAWNNFTD